MPKAKWKRLLHEGELAATASLGATRSYFCPICSLAFDTLSVTPEQLTLEHAPPRSLGGREIILTCKSCNSRAGSSVDAAAAERKRFREFADLVVGRRHGKDLPIILSGFDGVEFNARMSRDEDGFRFRIPHTINNPKKLSQSAESSKVLTSIHRKGGLKLGIRRQFRFSNRIADISDLRSAFLIATAKFGYTYAFSKSLNKVRQQILEPDQEVLHVAIARIRSSSSKFSIALSKDFGSVLIEVGDHVLVLPWCSTNAEKWLQFSKKLAAGENFNINAVSVPWPTRFQAVLDHDGRADKE